jgi:hypothetical protein
MSDAGLGHNNPPRPLTVEEVRAFLADQHTDLIERRNVLVDGIAEFLDAHEEIDDDDDQGAAAENVRMAAAHTKLIDAKRKIDKQPFLDAERAVDGFFKSIADPLDKALLPLRARMNAYAARVEKERRRAAQEELARKQREADEAVRAAQERMTAAALDKVEDTTVAVEQAERAAAAKPAELTRTYGQYGAVASVTTRWDFEVTDPMVLVQAVAAGLAPISCLSASATGIRAHLVTLPVVDLDGERTKLLPGVRVFEDRSVRVR